MSLYLGIVFMLSYVDDAKVNIESHQYWEERCARWHARKVQPWITPERLREIESNNICTYPEEWQYATIPVEPMDMEE